jgi:hypothetical protein
LVTCADDDLSGLQQSGADEIPDADAIPGLVRQPRAGFGGRRVSGRIGRVTQQTGHVAYDQASSGLRGARNS